MQSGMALSDLSASPRCVFMPTTASKSCNHHQFVYNNKKRGDSNSIWNQIKNKLILRETNAASTESIQCTDLV